MTKELSTKNLIEYKQKLKTMRKVILSVSIFAAIGLTSCKNEAKTEAVTTEMSNEIAMTEMSFGVRGNCGMCKTTIEKAAKGIEGVAKATWDVDKKKIDVSFEDEKTNVMAIHNAIAASGYDTEKTMGDLDAYDDLPGCCKYDHDMEMNQSGEKSEDDNSSKTN